MWCLTQKEREARINYDDQPQKGLRITFPSGVQHFIPGSSPEFAWTLMVNSPAAQWVEHPKTLIEYGERLKGAFKTERVVKAISEEKT